MTQNLPSNNEIFNKAIAEGKITAGECQISSCEYRGFVYKIMDGFICGECLEKVGKILKEKGMM